MLGGALALAVNRAFDAGVATLVTWATRPSVSLVCPESQRCPDLVCAPCPSLSCPAVHVAACAGDEDTTVQHVPVSCPGVAGPDPYALAAGAAAVGFVAGVAGALGCPRRQPVTVGTPLALEVSAPSPRGNLAAEAAAQLALVRARHRGAV